MKLLKKNKAKGFTIIELVIVIGVIGILTAILIPTFVNLINKANEASDISLVRNMNTALATYSVENKVETVNDVTYALSLNKIETFATSTANTTFVWDSRNNIILYVDSEGAVLNEKSVDTNSEDWYELNFTEYQTDDNTSPYEDLFA